MSSPIFQRVDTPQGRDPGAFKEVAATRFRVAVFLWLALYFVLVQSPDKGTLENPGIQSRGHATKQPSLVPEL